MKSLRLKGTDKFRERIPKFSGKKIIIVPIYCIIVFILSLIIQFYFDILPTLIPVVGGMRYLIIMFPILGVALMGSIAILLVFQMWYHRDRLKAKYGKLSYQKIFLVGFGGVVIIFSIVVHNLIPFYLWEDGFLSQFPFSIFITPLTSYFTPISLVLGDIRFILGVFICILGVMMVYRAIEIFGFDYMAVTYLYFPEESEIQDHKIYSVLRHPTYSAIMLVCLGGTVIYLTVYSIAFFLILYVGMLIHIYFVEEKELINRFGNSYKDYRKKVPALFVLPKNWGQFLKFILGKK